MDLVNKPIVPTKLIIMARWPALRKWEETVLAYTCTLASSLKFGRGLGTKLTYTCASAEMGGAAWPWEAWA